MSDTPSSAPARIEGFADETQGAAVRGWAWIPEQPERAVRVDLLDRAGAVVASGRAVHFRGDLRDAGKRDGACAFDLSLEPDAAGPFQLLAVDEAGGAGSLVLAERVHGPAYVDARLQPLRFGGETEVVGWIERADAQGVTGWAHWPEPFVTPPTLQLVEDGRVVAAAEANRWRSDLEDLRQGDGRCGFRLDLPDALYDGAEHWLELRLPDGRRLTSQALRIELPAEPPPRPAPATPARPPAGAPPTFSVVVNFYNMHREAERTLTSLSRRVQRDVGRLAYEVLCVDNGSEPPLSADFVSSFGPEFRLVRPSRPHPSPCGPLNEAAAQAKGRWLAVMIDGAHVLSPGALAEAHAALTLQPEAIVALRQWFVGGDQRWFSSVGYSPALEDVLFAKIDWPNAPYRLFDISSPMYESPNSWFDGLGESNCLFLPAALYRALGGFDEAFAAPGAGFANLDLFRRAASKAEAVVALVGEASFHQYHGGVTTNINDAEKDRRVRGYTHAYETARGEAFANVEPEHIRLSGALRTPTALTARQRLYSPVKLGITDRVRPRSAAIQFDELAQQFAQAAYVETGRHRETRWRGREVGVAPADLIDIQEALWRAKPERIVMKETAAGLVEFVASLLPVLGLQETRILWALGEAEPASVPPQVEVVSGDPLGPEVLACLERGVGDAERVLALFQPGAGDALPVDALAHYARFVSFESYLVVLGAALGQPWLGYSRLWLYRAIVRFTQGDHGFVVDRTLNRHFVTTCPSGFLRRVLNPLPLERYDPALDDLDGR